MAGRSRSARAACRVLERQRYPVLDAEPGAVRRGPAPRELVRGKAYFYSHSAGRSITLIRGGPGAITGAIRAFLEARAYFAAELLDGPGEFFCLTEPEFLLRLRKSRHFGVMSEAERVTATAKGKSPGHPGVVPECLVVE